MNPAKQDIRPVLAFVALWAAEEALTALVFGRIGLVQIVWTRFLLHLLLLLALFGWRDAASLWRTRRPARQLARAATMVGMPLCWQMGMQRGLSPATLMSVFWLAPLLILALATLCLKERASRRLWLATALACGGVFVLTGPHAVERPLLLVFPLGMALCFSLYMVLTRALRDEPARTNLFYTGLGVCLLLAPLLPARWVPPSAFDLAVLAGVATLGLGALAALERMTASAPVSRSAPLVYLQIPFALGIGWSLEQYDPSLRMVGGLLLVLLLVGYAFRLGPRSVTRLAADTGFGGLR
jgi:drug/metabolite transporter (DMT)-like permease